jgi:hypothetical protein
MYSFDGLPGGGGGGEKNNEPILVLLNGVRHGPATPARATMKIRQPLPIITYLRFVRMLERRRRSVRFVFFLLIESSFR